jgi:TPR repeat protein
MKFDKSPKAARGSLLEKGMISVALVACLSKGYANEEGKKRRIYLEGRTEGKKERQLGFDALFVSELEEAASHFQKAARLGDAEGMVQYATLVRKEYPELARFLDDAAACFGHPLMCLYKAAEAAQKSIWNKMNRKEVQFWLDMGHLKNVTADGLEAKARREAQETPE